MKEIIKAHIQKLSLQDKILVVMIFFYGIYVPADARFGLNIPVKPIFTCIGILLMINSFYFSSDESQIKCLIGLSFIGMELILFAVPLLLLLKVILQAVNSKNVFKFKIWSWAMLLFFCFDLILLAVSNFYDFSFYTILFWFIIFGFGFLLFIHYSEKTYSEASAENIFTFFRRLIMLQLIILPIQSLFHQRFVPGDFWNGSFIDADKISFYLVLLLLFEFAPSLFMKEKTAFKAAGIKKIFFLIAAAGALIMCDAKIKVALIFISLFLFSVFYLINKLFASAKLLSFNKVFLFALLFILSSGILLAAANLYLLYISNKKVSIAGTFEKYTIRPDTTGIKYGINGKYLVYKNVYSDLYDDNFSKWFWGIGPGKFGSRTSNMLAYDVFYKEKGQFKLPDAIPAYSSYEVKKYMKGMWTKQKAEYVKYISSNLSIPVGGWITIKAERGIPGILFYFVLQFILSFYLVRKASEISSNVLRKWSLVLGIFWIALPMLMIIDNIQEKPQMMYPMYLLTACLLGIISFRKIT